MTVTSDVPRRPSPDVLLEQARRERRGKHKIFLGAAPGVGKTYAMLEAAQQARRQGTDLVVGVIETHNQPETDRLVNGLAVVPRQGMIDQDRPCEEMDLDALLKRRPALALVDGLAHANVPGARHEKRWQDVEELLAAGIDVWTTLNVLHLESLNDVIERITGVRVQETVPDHVLAAADDIEMVDLAPGELLRRLADGKVHVPEQVRPAVAHFFSPGTLTALRELALRQAAERVDAQLISYMRDHDVAGPWPTRERIMVCVGPGPEASTVVRAAKRSAERRGAPWVAVHVEGPGRTLTETERDRVDAALRLAESLGGRSRILHGTDITGEILGCAREVNASVLVVGRPRRGRHWFGRDLTDDLVERLKDFDVLIVGGEEEPDARRRRPTLPAVPLGWRPFAETVAATMLATGLAALVDPFLDVANLSLIYLTAVLVVASRHGLVLSIATAVLCFFTYNFLFTDPHFTLRIDRNEDIISLLFFLLVAVVVGNLAARLKSQIETTRNSIRRTRTLFEFSRRVAAAAVLDDVLWAVVHHVASTIQGRSLVLLPQEGSLKIVAGYPPEDQLDPVSTAAVDWTWQHGVPAGRGSATLPAAPWLFLPLKTGRGQMGVLGVQITDRDGILSPEQVRLLDALADQGAVVIERAQLGADLEQARITAESERLRAALLSSISHDLRTPLVAVLGAATSLIEDDDTLSGERRLVLAQTIQDEAERLNHCVQNLLDMTVIGAGALKPKTDWVDLRAIVTAAVAQAGRLLRRRKLVVDLPDDLPLLSLDPTLMQQVFFNLLDNAVKYSPVQSPITIWARPRTGWVLIEVSDLGPGIAPEDREKVFDMFYRVRRTDRPVAGTGLGLAICRGIVEAHGGTIRVDSGLHGNGTSIVMALPIVVRPEMPAAPGGSA